MPLPVSLRDVVEELDALSQGMIAYCNRKTGELTSLTQEMLEAAEEENDLSDFDDDMLTELRDIVNSGDWVALPDSFEIHEWEILRDFVDQVEDDRVRGELQRAIQGSGAFRRFKEIARRYGIEDSWFDFKRLALEKIAREALEAAGIPYA
jgi:PAS domain-containing protein